MTAMIMRLAIIQMDHMFVSVMLVTLEMDLIAQVKIGFIKKTSREFNRIVEIYYQNPL